MVANQVRSIILLIIILGLIRVKGQNLAREITYGGSLGGVYSNVGGLESMIIPQHLYQGYETRTKGRLGLQLGLFLNWKYPSEHLSIQPELSYTGQQVDFIYHDNKRLDYTIGYKYNYLNIGFLLKYYFTDGFYIGTGPYLGLNLSKDALVYESNGASLSQSTGVYFEPDAVVQSVLKHSFLGKDYFYLGMGLGYEFENGLNVGIRYNLGVTDAISTESNGHRYREVFNKAQGFSVGLGYRFQFDSYRNF